LDPRVGQFPEEGSELHILWTLHAGENSTEHTFSSAAHVLQAGTDFLKAEPTMFKVMDPNIKWPLFVVHYKTKGKFVIVQNTIPFLQTARSAVITAEPQGHLCEYASINTF